jgi:hypothetical protein
MQKRRPTAVMVLAILHLVFGILGLIGGAAGGVMLAMGGQRAVTNMFVMGDAQMQKQTQGYTNDEMYDFLEKKIPDYELGQTISMGVDLFLSILLVISGIGLLKMQGWGRWGSIFYALFNIAWRLYTVYWCVTALAPAFTEFFQQAAAEAPNQQVKAMLNMMGPVMSVSFIVGPLTYLIYPAIVLIVMLLPSIGRAFCGEQLPGEGISPTYHEYHDRRGDADDERDE